ncbi:MAG: hypothetical protein ACP6IY_09560 [Promethearchaeia archaeon]
MNWRIIIVWTMSILNLIFLLKAIYLTITVSILYLAHSIGFFIIFGIFSGLFYKIFEKINNMMEDK